jgi:3-phenylpropionate/cinnamic acid dioxygenase small subunit
MTATLPGPPDEGDTDRWSHYVGLDFYRWLDELVQTWSQDWPPADAMVRLETEGVLAREARLVDEGQFNEWVRLFTEECLYWVPITAGGGDPRREVSYAFDDRRRLTDRVYWLRTGLAFCQIPQSRTRRLITNVEVLDSARYRLVRSNFVIYEYRAGLHRSYAGWLGHALQRRGDEWCIAVKQVNLLDAEQGHENLTLIF